MPNAAISLIIITTILGTLSTGCVGLRLYCSRLQKQGIGADSICIIIAWILSITMDIGIDYALWVTGAGDLSTQPTMDGMVYVLKWVLFCTLCQIAAMGFIKVSLLLYYRRIFISRTFKIASMALIVFVSGFTLSIWLTVLFSKWPVSQQWNPLAPYNIDAAAILIVFVVINSFSDLVTLSLPLAVIKSLQMPSQRKAILASIFTLGSVCMVASLLRLYWAIRYIQSPNTGQGYFTEAFIYNSLWAIIEPPVFIITGSIITLGPLWRAEHGLRYYFTSFRSRISLLLSSQRSNSATNADIDNTWKTYDGTQQEKHATRRAAWELPSSDTSSETR